VTTLALRAAVHAREGCAPGPGLSGKAGVGEGSPPDEWRYGRRVKREDLISLLTDNSPAHQACRTALNQGSFFYVDDGLIPANNHAFTYRAREAHTRERGIPTLGFAAAVERLHALGEQPLRLGGVRQSDPPYYFQLFLAADGTAVLACIGVDQQHQARRRAGNSP